MSEVIVILHQLIIFANTAAFFYSRLGLVSHSFRESDSGEVISTCDDSMCVEEINNSRNSWLVSRNDGL